MGRLEIPVGSRIYLDAQVVIYTVENDPVYHERMAPVWNAVEAGTAVVVSSELTLFETLIVPLRLRREDLIADFQSIWTRARATLLPITRDILLRAAELRALNPALRTPDAIHCATAEAVGCAMLITNDRRMPDPGSVRVVVLDDV